MAVDYSEFLDYTAEEIYQDWLNYITTRDSLIQDTSIASFNSILAEAIAAQFYIYKELLKVKISESSILTATGDALSAIVLTYLPEGRQAGTKSAGHLIFSRTVATTISITIPAGTMCGMASEDGELLQFETTEDAVLDVGETSVYAEAQSIGTGVKYNVASGTISIILTPVVGISGVSNDAAFTEGTDQESDEDLRKRALYTIWIPGKATIPLMEEHIAGVEGVSEAHVDTQGQGDVLIIVDSVGGTAEPETAIGDMIEENLAAGCTACGLLGASIRAAGSTYQLADCSGGKVWVRALQYVASITTVNFTYLDDEGASKSGSAVFPAGSPAGYVVAATMASTDSLASKIMGSSYAGSLEFDLFMGLGTYPYLWVAPELQDVDVAVEVVLTDTPEANLLEKIEASLTAKLSTYRIGDKLEYADLVPFLYIDYETKVPFVGIDDISSFSITCKGETISAFGESVEMDNDERCQAGTIAATEV